MAGEGYEYAMMDRENTGAHRNSYLEKIARRIFN